MDRPDHPDEPDRAWASDDIPVPDSPIEPTWKRPPDPEPPELDPLTAPARHESDAVDAGGDSAPWKWAIAALVAIALVGAVSVRVTSDGDDTSTEAPVSSVEPTSPAVTAVDETIPEGPDEDSGFGAGSLGPEQLELPPEVAAIVAPTEIVAIADDGVIHTVSLPSGRVRSLAVADVDEQAGFNGPGIVVAPDAAAAVYGSELIIAPRRGPATVVDREEFDLGSLEVRGWHRDTDGATLFRIVRYDNASPLSYFDVSLDGSIEAVAATDVSSGVFSPGFAAVEGTMYLNDAGGVYRVAADGTAQRIDTGTLLAAHEAFRLVRNCTETLECGFDVVDQASGERRRVAPEILSADLQSSVFAYELSPDGSALSALRGTTNGQERIVIDLGTGASIVSPMQWGGNGSTRWAADSSGVFEASGSEPGLEFLDRVSGTVVRFGDELGRLLSLGTRAPDAELGPAADVDRLPISLVPADPSDIGSAELSTTGLTVIGVGRSGVMVIDVDERKAMSWGSLGLPAGRPVAMAVDDGVAVLSNAGGFRSRPGDEIELSAELLGEGWIVAGPSPGTAWTQVASEDGVRYRLVDLDDGQEVSPSQTIDLPSGAVVLGGDGQGGLLVSRGGDVYVGSIDGTQRITAGQVLALGLDVAIVRECDDRLVCRLVRIDRSSGERLTVESPSLLGTAADAADSDGLLGTSVSPDGGVALVEVPLTVSDEPRDTTAENTRRSEVWVFVDLETSATTSVDGLIESQPVVWSADGQYAAVLVRSGVVVYDRAAARLIEVEGTGPLRAIAPAR